MYGTQQQLGAKEVDAVQRPGRPVLAHGRVDEDTVHVDLHVLGARRVFLEGGEEQRRVFVPLPALAPPGEAKDLLGLTQGDLHGVALGGRACPDAPGFKKILIKPAIVGDLTWVRAHFDSPHGRIASSWKRTGNKFVLDVSVPANTTATVYVPALSGAPATGVEGVTERGNAIADTQGVNFLRMEAGAVVLAVESGSYQFVR